MQVGVIGAGTMGAGIAHAFAVNGTSVVVAEPNEAQRHAATTRIRGVLDGGVERGRITAEKRDEAVGLIQMANGIDALAPGLDLIVEAVPEVADLKATVLAAAEDRDPQVLASNTSAISIDELAASLRRPERFVGLHFFNPVWSMKLVEIVVGSATAAGVVDEARTIVGGIGKEPVVVKDAPGFASSRLGVLLGLEAMRMLEQGVASAEDIDKAMVLGYGHPMGPLRLTDLVGLDIRLDIARNLAKAYGPRFEPPPILERMVADGKLGQKSGQGFYSWDR
jgi:3-hydroxybutyryl-CoA dehydrogenase